MININVLSLFDGISCGYEALKRANIKVDKYFASEIDKYAIQVSSKNHPDIIQLGDIKELDTTTLPKIDLLIGGSPCQDLSIAKQNRKGLGGERSGLFWEYVRILEEVKPKYFLLENVASMSKADKETITEALGVEPVLINSALVSGQNRRRLYWTNILNITQPKDKGIKLADILEYGVPHREKSHCITASYSRTSLRDDIVKHSRTNVAVPAKGCAVRTWPRNTKEICEPIRIGEIGKTGQANRVYSVQGKSVCLNANGGGGGAKTGLYKIDLPDGDYYIRKLTPLECERLQTLPSTKDYVIIDFEKEIITWFAEHQYTNAPFATEKCHKSQKLVGIAGKKDLKEFARFVGKNSNIKNQPIKEPAVFTVPINYEELNRNKDYRKKMKESVSNAENLFLFHLQNLIVDFVQANVGESIIPEKKILLGRVESHPKEKNYIQVNCGEKELNKFGKEITELVKDVGKNVTIQEKLSKFITSYHLKKKNLEQTLIILYYFVMIAINGCIQNKTKATIILEIERGYTDVGISNTQRYKCIGNAWTADVIAHILSFIKSY